MKLQVIVHKKKGAYIASSSELDIPFCQDNSPVKTAENFKKAAEGFFKTASQEEIKKRLKKKTADERDGSGRRKLICFVEIF